MEDINDSKKEEIEEEDKKKEIEEEIKKGYEEAYRQKVREKYEAIKAEKEAKKIEQKVEREEKLKAIGVGGVLKESVSKVLNVFKNPETKQKLSEGYYSRNPSQAPTILKKYYADSQPAKVRKVKKIVYVKSKKNPNQFVKKTIVKKVPISRQTGRVERSGQTKSFFGTGLNVNFGNEGFGKSNGKKNKGSMGWGVDFNKF